MKVLLGITGSVAATLTHKLVADLQEEGHEVKVVFTKSGSFFCAFSVMDFPFYTDKDEWAIPYKKGNEILHIELGKWADVVVLAPLSENTMAKLAHGICDNLLTSLILALPKNKPIVLAPAMNTNMWENPITQENLDKVMRTYNALCVPPVQKTLACGDTGVGALAPIERIVAMTEIAYRDRNRPRVVHLRTPCLDTTKY